VEYQHQGEKVTIGLREKCKMKIPIYALVMLAMVGVVGAVMCHEEVDAGGYCKMLTPSLTNCSIYNYSIINVTGVLVENGNLTSFYPPVYYLNFSYTNIPGEYITLLCDGSTREIKVKNDDTTMIAVALLFSLLIMFSAGATIYFTTMRHALTYMFLMLTVIFIDMTVWTSAKIASEAGYSWAFVGWRMFWVMMFVTLIMFFAVAIHFTNVAREAVNNKKLDAKKKMFGDSFG